MKEYTVTSIEPATVETIHNTSLNMRTGYIFKGEGLQVTDGYHTMEELYNHRYALFIALCRIYDNYVTPLGCRVKCWKSKLHSDGTMFDDSFILGMTISS